ncbi:hypothetical protein INT44_000294 [Umbelopsis vinacea]|uniref:Uncharacterized protein n=1 Tax=Umbelopsis vinacea TaxID=44442 RepID=A0A8H7PMA1_9FUNG|nr:hypothetical protein INT44_000294 [Umbelopsis vinacea]
MFNRTPSAIALKAEDLEEFDELEELEIKNNIKKGKGRVTPQQTKIDGFTFAQPPTPDKKVRTFFDSKPAPSKRNTTLNQRLGIEEFPG